MAKTYKKTHNELEHLRGLVKKLKSENRQLRKRVKELDKKAHFYEDVVDEAIEDVSLKNVCKLCNRGVLQEIDLHTKILIKCDNCDYRKTKNK